MKYLHKIPMATFLILAGLATIGLTFPYYDYVICVSGVLAGILYLFQK